MTNYITKTIKNGVEANIPVTSVNGQYGDVTVQPTLVSGTNIKTVQGNSLLGSGNLVLYSAITVTLTTAGWSNNEQSVTATGVTASNAVVISPTPASIEDYTGAMVYCSAQASNSLTFTCTAVPENDITVNVLIFN